MTRRLSDRSAMPTEEEWVLFVRLPFPARLYKHTCKAGLWTVGGRQCFESEWIDHNHVASTAGEAIRKASEAAWSEERRTPRRDSCPKR